MFKTLLQQLLGVIYPAFCFYCKKSVPSPAQLLCTSCVKTLELAYHDLDASDVYCFEYTSAASALLRAFERTHFCSLKEVIVSFLVVQYTRLHQNLPDLILPALKKKNHPIAQAFARRIDKPYLEAFKYVLDPMVYDQEGKLVGVMTLKQQALDQMRSTQHLLIIDGYDHTPAEYRGLLESQGYEQVTYLSVLLTRIL